jgi:predicted nucleic acid-binding protein
VIDSGVVIKWFIGEPYSTEASRVLNAYQAGNLILLAPEFIYAEVGNILWKKERFQGFTPHTTRAVLTSLQNLAMSVTPARDLLDDAYEIAITHGRTVYDALYLALSIREGCRFVTADERLFNAVGPAFPNLVWVANWS